MKIFFSRFMGGAVALFFVQACGEGPDAEEQKIAHSLNQYNMAGHKAAAADISPFPATQEGPHEPTDETSLRMQYNCTAAEQLRQILARQMPHKHVVTQPIVEYGNSSTVQLAVDIYDRQNDETTALDVAPRKRFFAKYVPQNSFSFQRHSQADFRTSRIASLMQEGRVQAKAAEADLAPRVHRLDAQHGYILTDFIDGHTLNDADMNTFAVQREVAQMAARTHALTYEISQSLSQTDFPRLYEHRLLRSIRMNRLPEQTVALYFSYIETLKQMAHLLPKQVRLLHGDILGKNIMREQQTGRLWLVDFEHAVYADPMVDLSAFLLDTSDPQQLRAVIAAYEEVSTPSAGPGAYERLLAHRALLQTQTLPTSFDDDQDSLDEGSYAPAIKNVQRSLELIGAFSWIKGSLTLTTLVEQATIRLNQFLQALKNGRRAADSASDVVADPCGVFETNLSSASQADATAHERLTAALDSLGMQAAVVTSISAHNTQALFFRAQKGHRDLFVKVL